MHTVLKQSSTGRAGWIVATCSMLTAQPLPPITRKVSVHSQAETKTDQSCMRCQGRPTSTNQAGCEAPSMLASAELTTCDAEMHPLGSSAQQRASAHVLACTADFRCVQPAGSSSWWFHSSNVPEPVFCLLDTC